MPKLGEFLNTLAIKSGLPVDHDKLKALLSDPVCSTFEVDLVIADSINKGLMTEEAAINNTVILNKARAEAYNKVDETLAKTIYDLFEESDKAEILSKKYTVDKITEISKVISKLKEAKKDAGSNVDKAVYQKQIDELQAAIKLEKANAESEISKLKQSFENESIESNLKSMLGGRNYRLSTETEQDKQFAIDAALLKVKQELGAKGYKVIRENGTPKLVTSENLKVFEGNNEVSLNNFVEGAIAQLIAPSKQEPNTPPASGGGQPVPGNKTNIDAAVAEFMSSIGQ